MAQPSYDFPSALVSESLLFPLEIDANVLEREIVWEYPMRDQGYLGI